MPFSAIVGDDASDAQDRYHVLVVDDERLVREVIRRALERANYRVTDCSSAREALQKVRECDVDVIVSDINMPDMDGLEMMSELTRCHVDAEVIFATGMPSLETAARAVECGAFRYLSKPVSPDELGGVVREAIRVKNAARHERGLAKLDRLEADRKRELGESFDEALQQLWIAYQPICDAQTRRVVACEGLVRSDHTTLFHPGVLFSAATELDRLGHLGRVIRKHVCQPLTKRDDLLLFVNLHTSDLDDEDLYDPSTSLALFARHIVLEITERDSLETVKNVTERSAQLREMGFRIAVDDLGAGYSGLNALALLEPEYVKLDMSLIRGIHESKTKRTLVRAMTAMCRELEAQVVAEGIETEEELRTVQDLGCNLVQGFFLGRPQRAYPLEAQVQVGSEAVCSGSP